jgi:hypothetical protein
MDSFAFRLVRKMRFVLAYLRSALMGVLKKKEFARIENFCMFIGYPRSGHSLVAALLDAHPEVVMGMEWGVLQHLKAGYGKYQVYYSLVRNARMFSLRKGNNWTGYSYRVEGQWQGRYQRIKVIGDKMGGRTSLLLEDHPELLGKLTRTVELPVKWIHVIRNPFDTITTMTLRMMEKQKSPPVNEASGHLGFFVDSYFRRVAAVSGFIESGKLDILHVFHEDFIDDPQKELVRILNFIGLEAGGSYLEECAKIVYHKPHRSREKIQWTTQMIKKVEEEIGKYDFLGRYSYES